LGNAVLGALGGRLESSLRREFQQAAKLVFETAPIETVRTLFGLIGRGKDYDEEARANHAFETAKAKGPGSPEDRYTRTMASGYADDVAKNAPIESVVVLLDVFEMVIDRNIKVNSDNVEPLLDEAIENLERSTLPRHQYVRDKSAGRVTD